MFGPVFGVEMTSTARRARYFVLRVIYGLILLASLGLLYASDFRFSGLGNVRRVAEFASAYFVTFSVIQLAAVLLCGPAMAAGTIAVERDRRTIEYLFATDLSNFEIVFGKLAARLAVIGGLVLVGLPILSITMLLGGISPAKLWAMFALTLSTMVAVTALSISVSVWSPRARDAVLRVYIILLALVALPPVAFAWFFRESWYGAIAWLIDPLLAGNPLWIAPQVLYFQVTPFGQAISPWAMVGELAAWQGGLSLGCTLLALTAVRRVHLNYAGKSASKNESLARALAPGIGERAMLWKELYVERAMARLGIIGRIAFWLIVIAVVGGTLYTFIYDLEHERQNRGIGFYRRHEMYFLYAATMTTILSSAASLLLAARGATSITHEKERDTWVSLLAAPLEPREIIAAKMWGNLYAVRGLGFLIALVWMLGSFLNPACIIAIPFMAVTYLVIGLFVTLLGIHFSLTSGNSLRAMGATLGVTVVIGGGVSAVCGIGGAISGAGEAFAGVVLAPCFPFLMAIPPFAFVESDMLRQFPMLSYVLGMIGYSVAAFALWNSAVVEFDRHVGRAGIIVYR